MQSRARTSVYWGLGLTAAVHGLLWWLLLQLEAPREATSVQPGAVLDVVTVQPVSAAPVMPPVPEQLALAPPVLPEVMLVPPAETGRDAVRYYAQDELDVPAMVVRDGTGEADIEAPPGLYLNLFIDVEGKVAGITFEGEPLTADQEATLREAFMTLEFLPGKKDGSAVPSRIKIQLTSASGTVQR